MLLPIPWSTNVEILEVAHISCVLQNLRIKYNIYIFFFKDLSHGLEPKKTCRFKGAALWHESYPSFSKWPISFQLPPSCIAHFAFFFIKGSVSFQWSVTLACSLSHSLSHVWWWRMAMHTNTCIRSGVRATLCRSADLPCSAPRHCMMGMFLWPTYLSLMRAHCIGIRISRQ